MATVKKATLSLFIILLILLGLTQIVSSVETGKVNEDAKLKKTMDDSSITLEIIPKNDTFEILEEHDSWYRVNYKRIKGYVKKEQVEIIEQKTNNEINGEQSNNTKEQESQDTKENNTSESLIQEIQPGSKLYTKSELKVFLRPLLNSMKIETLQATQEVVALDTTSKWVYISVNGKTGWVQKELLMTENQKQEGQQEPSKENQNQEVKYLNKTAYVTSDGINFRQEPNTDSKILKTFLQNAKITILLEEGNWYKIKHNDQEGYILKMYVSEKKVEVTSRSSATRQNNTQVQETTQANNNEKEETTTDPVTTQVSSKASEIVKLAKKYLGSRYVYGGSSPSGFDCSGFTMYLYKQFGVSLPHSSTAQSNRGTRVSKANLQPGDIVFFKDYRTNVGIGHCGIYIGNNQFIHASTEKTGVITSSLTSSSYQKRYVTAVRIF